MIKVPYKQFYFYIEIINNEDSLLKDNFDLASGIYRKDNY